MTMLLQRYFAVYVTYMWDVKKFICQIGLSRIFVQFEESEQNTQYVRDMRK